LRLGHAFLERTQNVARGLEIVADEAVTGVDAPLTRVAEGSRAVSSPLWIRCVMDIGATSWPPFRATRAKGGLFFARNCLSAAA
jgi:hypothetical protein